MGRGILAEPGRGSACGRPQTKDTKAVMLSIAQDYKKLNLRAEQPANGATKMFSDSKRNRVNRLSRLILDEQGGIPRQ